MNCIFVTNNDILEKEKNEKVFIHGSSLDVLLKARTLVHQGHKLVSSPIGASIRMIMSPIKTIIMEKEQSELDELSIFIIESAIEKHKMITANRGEDSLNSHDYKIIDIELTANALKEAQIF